MTDGLMGEGLGIFVSMESFAVRALLGSLLAALVAALAAKLGLVRSGQARRALILAPVVVAVAAAVACMVPGGTFLPSLVVSSADGQPFEVFGAPFTIRRLEWLVVAYVAAVTFLLLRRAVGHWAIHRYVASATAVDDDELLAVVRRLANKLGIEAPIVLRVPNCPGGAFTTGVRRPTIAVDPSLLDTLDAREVEGLVAHELAHIARRDVLTNTGVGIVRDLTFFVPPMSLAIRWLRHEQEHWADDLASDSTGRPAALASSILKVWERTERGGHRHLTAMACATMVPSGVLPIPAGMPTRLLRQGSLTGGAKAIAERVVRLIERGAPVTVCRQRVELTLALAAVVMATAVTVVLPSQVNGELLLAQWSRPIAEPVASPAMDTFLATAAGTPLLPDAVPAVAVQRQSAATCGSCLPIESGHEWRTGMSPSLTPRQPGWQADGRVWSAAEEGVPTPPNAMPLWGVDSERSRVGIYVVRSSGR